MAVPTGRQGGDSLFPSTSSNDVEDWGGGTRHSVDATICAIFYVAIIVIFAMIILLIVKLMRDIDDDGDPTATTEQTALLPAAKEEIEYSWYGSAGGGGDLESGGGSTSSITSSDDDLYDAKICVICYDDQRSCFFIPCGHCITCHSCAHRIVTDENKSCPICRTVINNVTRLHIL
ncbi:E3 ubiquitin-protein ligase APD2-like [Andrographis paniculata]|uniref:E3 ubiquitin-protein ligase APD2-like n=1 Tax=Andrographis paniculata TaxID=175694 RepID=UPI0021E7336A|nr:E3 ubiquitin-protein ligase APD2-like [Andrographis paniculata]